ncbi:hypothetical protein [Rhodocyclus tenuis]|uniref:hypothetical protein n=1 Tax=Rhodocyclus tenuis TaxID=1066 RepID=UPI0019041814|nr:hypothetical protein [Rhodocyclus tenuis]MBK1679879.1 hypothetical protein [Rhodocyclus tenuis]
MKAANLHDAWASPDNSRLTPKQFSFRLPIHVAAKLAALCDMYPRKTRTQIIADLLASALDELEEKLPMELGYPADDDESEHYARQYAEEKGFDYEKPYHLSGPRAKFRNLANEYFEALEKELGNESPAPLFEPKYISESQLKK